MKAMQKKNHALYIRSWLTLTSSRLIKVPDSKIWLVHSLFFFRLKNQSMKYKDFASFRTKDGQK